MYKKISIALLVIAAFLYWIYAKPSAQQVQTVPLNGEVISGAFDQKKFKSKEQWRQILTKEQYNILQEAGTEIPYTGELNSEKRAGTYYSHGCDVPLFRSESKYDSGTGWPSFTEPITIDALVLRRELDGRVEVLDPCGGHLGHVFDDGPAPTGKRYCMNSVALRFVPDISAAFLIITNGLTRNFSARMYHNQDPALFVESSDPSIIHVKREGVTWGDFFATLPMKLDNTCLTTGTGEIFCTSNTHTLKFLLRDEVVPGALDTLIEAGDKLVVEYGPNN